MSFHFNKKSFQNRSLKIRYFGGRGSPLSTSGPKVSKWNSGLLIIHPYSWFVVSGMGRMSLLSASFTFLFTSLKKADSLDTSCSFLCSSLKRRFFTRKIITDNKIILVFTQNPAPPTFPVLVSFFFGLDIRFPEFTFCDCVFYSFHVRLFPERHVKTFKSNLKCQKWIMTVNHKGGYVVARRRVLN